MDSDETRRSQALRIRVTLELSRSDDPLLFDALVQLKKGRRRVPRLRTLVVTSCPALECGSLVHAMVACPDLLRMHLPGWLRLQLAGRVPVRSPPDDEACSEVQPWRPQHMLHLDTTSSDY